MPIEEMTDQHKSLLIEERTEFITGKETKIEVSTVVTITLEDVRKAFRSMKNGRLPRPGEVMPKILS